MIILINVVIGNNTVQNSPLHEFVPYYQEHTEINKEMLTVIWKQAMEAKALYNNLNPIYSEILDLILMFCPPISHQGKTQTK